MSARGAPVPRVWYFAGPITSYRTRRRHHAGWVLHDRLAPCDVWLDPETMYRAAEGWQATWPAVLAMLTDLAVLADTDGTVGAGVAREVADAHRAGVHVWRADAAGRLRPADGWELHVLHRPTVWRWARWARTDPHRRHRVSNSAGADPSR